VTTQGRADGARLATSACSASGIAFAALALVAFLIARGPPDTSNPAILIRYFGLHESAVRWQTALVGLAGILFLAFAGALASHLRANLDRPDLRMYANIGVAGAAATTTLYFVGLGCWRTMADLFGDAEEFSSTSREALGDTQVLYNLGHSAVDMANFTGAAFVGATAAGLLGGPRRGRAIGWASAAVALLMTLTGVLRVVSDTDFSETTGTVVFLIFLAWAALTGALVSRWTARSMA
jgi:hypothetical protein